MSYCITRFPYFPAYYYMPCKGLYFPETRSQAYVPGASPPHRTYSIDRRTFVRVEHLFPLHCFSLFRRQRAQTPNRREGVTWSGTMARRPRAVLQVVRRRVMSLYCTISAKVLLHRVFDSIFSCSVGLSPHTGSLLSRPHPSCMREGAYLSMERRRVRRTLLLCLTGFQGPADHPDSPAIPCTPLFPLPPGLRSFVRLSDKWKRVRPW